MKNRVTGSLETLVRQYRLQWRQTPSLFRIPPQLEITSPSRQVDTVSNGPGKMIFCGKNESTSRGAYLAASHTMADFSIPRLIMG